MPIRVLIVDDHALLREGVRLLLESADDIEVVGEAADGVEAIRMAKALSPRIVLMDLSMPAMDGARSATLLGERVPDVAVIALTRHADQGYLQHAVRAGVKGYVLKQAAARELLSAIRAVAAGGSYIDPELAGKVMGGLLQKHGTDRTDAPPALSPREEQVLRMIARGHSNRDIAGLIGISVKTVEYQRARGMEKLNLRSRVDIVQHAVRQGWLQDE